MTTADAIARTLDLSRRYPDLRLDARERWQERGLRGCYVVLWSAGGNRGLLFREPDFGEFCKLVSAVLAARQNWRADYVRAA